MLDRTFDVTLILKGLDGLFELVGGILLIVVSPETINHLAKMITQHELSQDPHDFIAHRLLRLTANLHNTQLFGAIYLLTHGLVKIVLVIGLLRREHWAYYFAFVFLGGFVVYQVYRLAYAPSIGLALLTAFDVFIIWLTWREYQRMRAARAEVRSAPAYAVRAPFGPPGTTHRPSPTGASGQPRPSAARGVAGVEPATPQGRVASPTSRNRLPCRGPCPVGMSTDQNMGLDQHFCVENRWRWRESNPRPSVLRRSFSERSRCGISGPPPLPAEGGGPQSTEVSPRAR